MLLLQLSGFSCKTIQLQTTLQTSWVLETVFCTSGTGSDPLIKIWWKYVSVFLTLFAVTVCFSIHILNSDFIFVFKIITILIVVSLSLKQLQIIIILVLVTTLVALVTLYTRHTLIMFTKSFSISVSTFCDWHTIANLQHNTMIVSADWQAERARKHITISLRQCKHTTLKWNLSGRLWRMVTILFTIKFWPSRNRTSLLISFGSTGFVPGLYTNDAF